MNVGVEGWPKNRKALSFPSYGSMNVPRGSAAYTAFNSLLHLQRERTFCMIWYHLYHYSYKMFNLGVFVMNTRVVSNPTQRCIFDDSLLVDRTNHGVVLGFPLPV